MNDLSPRATAGASSVQMHERRPFGDALFAVSGMAAGVVVALAATGIRVPPGSSNVFGPRTFPYAVAALLVLSSLASLIGVLRGHGGAAEEGEDVDTSVSTDWVTVGTICALFVVFALIIQPLGWPVAVTLLFGGTAWKLGAKRWWVAASVGSGLGLLTQVLFGTMLGISLPAGPLLNWIGVFNG